MVVRRERVKENYWKILEIEKGNPRSQCVGRDALDLTYDTKQNKCIFFQCHASKRAPIVLPIVMQFGVRRLVTFLQEMKRNGVKSTSNL